MIYSVLLILALVGFGVYVVLGPNVDYVYSALSLVERMEVALPNALDIIIVICVFAFIVFLVLRCVNEYEIPLVGISNFLIILTTLIIALLDRYSLGIDYNDSYIFYNLVPIVLSVILLIISIFKEAEFYQTILILLSNILSIYLGIALLKVVIAIGGFIFGISLFVLMFFFVRVEK